MRIPSPLREDRPPAFSPRWRRVTVPPCVELQGRIPHRSVRRWNFRNGKYLVAQRDDSVPVQPETAGRPDREGGDIAPSLRDRIRIPVRSIALTTTCMGGKPSSQSWEILDERRFPGFGKRPCVIYAGDYFLNEYR